MPIQPQLLLISTTIILLILLFIYLLHKYNQYTKALPSTPQTLILLSSTNTQETQWQLIENQAMLIGKTQNNTKPDIDLSDCDNSDYISNEHAVLNYAQGYWYIEDLESNNGVGIKKQGTDTPLRLKPNKPYKISKGDTLYISKTKMILE